MLIDHSVYPDLDFPPEELNSPEEKADYLQRVCGAWDFGIVPELATFELFAGWREVFADFPLPHSPACRAFCIWFGWPAPPGSCLAADYEKFDEAEGREDPCARWV